MKKDEEKKHGDFTGLAENYSKYRPGYSETVLSALLGMLETPVSDIDFADVGAGTGIWTRMVYKRGCRSVCAVEPNDDMRAHGAADSVNMKIKWLKGSGEETGLDSASVDFLTMASSFHWADFDTAVKEFYRILRPGGRFCVLWNPRNIEANPLLVEIENKLYEIAPDIKRKSSGRSGITEVLTSKLEDCVYFDDVVYLEGRHVEKQSPEHYLGIWRSVNDIRVQAGEKRFAEFMNYVEKRVSGLEYIEAPYLTRAWCAKRV